jgi:glutathione S-transferase
MQPPLVFKGAPGSPYTRKMMALMRYRHIPYRYLIGEAADRAGMPKPPVELLPTFYLPDAQGQMQAVTDSTPLLRRLEGEISGRAARPHSAVLAFIDSLLEDFADEWVTKAMFHYRWHYAPDIDRASKTIPLHWGGIQIDEKVYAPSRAFFSKRQIDRLPVIGSNPTTAPLIEAGYLRMLKLLDAHFAQHAFLMGGRPGASDFAMYGQLSQLALFDPTSMGLAVQHAPRAFAWTGWMEDLSGLQVQDDAWLDAARLPSTLMDLLAELAQAYVPVLLANARALLPGEKHFSVELPQGLWEQGTVTYQGKCLRWLREEFAALDTAGQTHADAILQAAGIADVIHAPL